MRKSLIINLKKNKVYNRVFTQIVSVRIDIQIWVDKVVIVKTENVETKKSLYAHIIDNLLI